MGGLLWWWRGGVDERVSVCIDVWGEVDEERLIETKNLDRDGFY